MQKTKKSPKFWLALVIFSLVGQVAWVVENMYFNVFIYKMFHASASAISTMVAASAIAATVTTLLIGALSDKIGKRKLFICGGYILWGLSIWSFAFIRTDIIESLLPTQAMALNLPSAASIGVSLVIIMDCVMTFFGSSANDAAFNAWLTDSTDRSNRGAAEGINAMMPLVAILVVFGGFMALDLGSAESWTLIYAIIGTVVLLIGILGIFIIEDTCVKTDENSHYFRNIFYGFRPSVMRENKILYMTLLAFAVFGISIQIFMPYLILYYNVSLGMDNYVIIMAPAIIIAAVVTALYGRFYDRCGFKISIIPSLLMLMSGYVLLYFFRSTALVFAGSLLMMCGYLSGMAVFGAMVRDYTPEHRAGMFQGLRIVGQVLIPGVIGPYIGALVLRNADTIVGDDGTVSFIPNENIYLAAFAAAIFIWLLLIPLYRMIGKRRAGREECAANER
ncbi:MAG: MFS transporter [Clostridia bacterium]|nr:MFS transporter [Clostridia bacterium]